MNCHGFDLYCIGLNQRSFSLTSFILSAPVKSWFKRPPPPASPPTSATAPAPQRAVTVDELIAAGNALEDQGDPAAALVRYRQAEELNPRSAKPYLNAGNALRLLGDLAGAVSNYRLAATLDPTSAGAQLNLGITLLAQGQSQAAEQAYRAALRLRPDWVDAWIGLGGALEDGKALDEAAAAYARALALRPDHGGAASNLSALQLRALDVTAARQTLTAYLQHAQQDRAMLQRLAFLEMDAGRIDESLALQRALIEQQPDDFAAWSVLFFHSCYQPELDLAEHFALQRRYGQLLEATVQPLPLPVPAAADRGRRLRVGYVSADLCVHPIANFIHPVLRCHDRQRFEVYCYHTQDKSDWLTAELKALTGQWREAAALDDAQLAQLIQQDRIDILVDLSGHSGGNRLGVFARKPAPLQYTWLGYLGSTGLTRMDYRLCDAHTDPAGAEQLQTETPARLPDSQWCYDQRTAAVPALTPLPRLARGHWTFGSFNNYRKLNPRVYAAWAAVLKAVPDSRLELFSFENRESGERAMAALAALGIERGRLNWRLRTGPQEHFESFAGIDVALDCFPYNGATTTCDALLMGVPVLAVAGTRAIARGGLSLLSSAGLPDWIAPSEAELAAVARRQLAEVQAVARLRAELPQRLRESALMDAPRFTRNLEAHYDAAWRRRCESAGR
jgi:protein O-GlcNAc transferase